MEALHNLSGNMFRDMLISAANSLAAQKQPINELNVFPVPDGDTGTNMSMTMNAAMRELIRLNDCSISETAETAASSLLRGARGNSGVILSLLFRGIAKILKNKTEATGDDIIEALQSGVDAAYKAVMKPIEGTILTVAREAAEACVALKANGTDVIKVFETAASTAQKTLAKTPEMLPVLKKAGVVDAGGKGLVVIFDAFVYTLQGNGIITSQLQEQSEQSIYSAASQTDDDEEIVFAYCTEFIINKDADHQKDSLALRAYLEALGDSVLVADESNFIKVHVHSNNPDKVLSEALTYGYLTDVKIDNMRIQHKNNVAKAKQKTVINKPFGFVVVAAGKGITSLFTDLGADMVVEGGQTMNPSTEDILAAIEQTPAEMVIVLPNNKNIILAAEQTTALTDRKVHVLHTKSIPQGITAMLSFDADADINTNLINMAAAAEKVKTGLITFAARDSDFDGHKIKKDEILALANGKLMFTENDVVKAAIRLTRSLADKNSSYITLIFGNDTTAEQADRARDSISEKLGADVEVNVISGGQPVYHFIISVE
jgi:DAK2 domain fusion protein YloV